jgi:endo-beta-N-acetylglucosaminidase D
MSETFYHQRISLGDREWGNENMRRAAQQWFDENANIATNTIVEVYEHGGWFLSFIHDGTVVGTANDMAQWNDKQKAARDRFRQPGIEWKYLSGIRRQHLIDAGTIQPLPES